MRYFISVCLLVIVVHGLALGQDCRLTIKGRILDENSIDALDGANVVWVETEQNVQTDSKGRFVLSNLCAGRVTLAITHIGCETSLFSFQLTNDTSLKVKLNHKEEHLNEVEVLQHRKESHVTQQVEQLEGAALRKLKGLTLGETLRKFPGITTLNTGATIAKPVIHGLHSNRVLILNNGVRQESQQWGTEHAPEIDPFIAKQITVVKGANSLRYGSDAMGGVILIDPAALPSSPGIGGEFNAAVYSNNAEVDLSAMLEGNPAKVAPLSWRVQGTFRQGGNSRTPNYWLKNTGVQEGNFSVAGGWKKVNYGVEVFYSFFKTQIGIFSAAHFHNLTDLEQAITSTVPRELSGFTYKIDRPYQDILHQLAKTKIYFNTGKAGDMSIVFALQHNKRTEYDKHKPLGDNDNRPGFQFAIQTISADINWEHQPTKGFSGVIGFNGTTQTNNYSYGYFIPGFWNFAGGLFAVERWNYRKVELEAGVRLDYRWLQAYLPQNRGGEKPIRQWLVPSGSIGLDYHITENLKWNINIASAWRAPQVSELYADGVHHGAASFERGNADLKQEMSLDLSTSFQTSFSWLTATVGFYQYFIQDFIYAKPSLTSQLTIRGAYPAFDYTPANVSLTGGDVDLTIKPYRGIELTNRISLLRAWNRTANEWLIMMPPQRFEHGLRYTFRDFKPVKGLYVGASAQIVLQQKLAPKNQDYLPPPSGYWLLNMEAGASFAIRQQFIHLNLVVNNALNTVYRDYLNRFRYFADERGLNVSLKIAVPFFIPTQLNSSN